MRFAVPSAAALLAGLGALACGDAREFAPLTVALSVPSLESLDPFRADERMSFVRVTVSGVEAGDLVTADLAAGATSVAFDGFPIAGEEAAQRTIDVVVQGFDDYGNQLAYGRALGVAFEGETNVSVPFRRALAYVAHQAVCGFGCGDEGACVDAGAGFECLPRATECGACGAGRACVQLSGGSRRCRPVFTGSTEGPGHLYVLDAFGRNVVERVPLPGAAPRALELSAYEGEQVVTTMIEGGRGKIGLLSTASHEWRVGELNDPAGLPLTPTHAVLGRGQAVGLAAGGGYIVTFDPASFATLTGRLIPGSVRDVAVGLDGTRAIVVVNQEPYVFLVDLSDPSSPASISTPASSTGGGGVAISEDGRLAYVTSDADGSVVVIDLLRGIARAGKGRFPAAARQVVYSEYTSSLLAVQSADDPGAVRDAMLWTTDPTFERGYGPAVGRFQRASGLAGLPGGRRALLVSPSTSTLSASLTALELSRDQSNPIAASKGLYPLDAVERKVSGLRPGVECQGFDRTNAPESCRIYEYQRYQPRSITVLYGS